MIYKFSSKKTRLEGFFKPGDVLMIRDAPYIVKSVKIGCSSYAAEYEIIAPDNLIQNCYLFSHSFKKI